MLCVVIYVADSYAWLTIADSNDLCKNNYDQVRKSPVAKKYYTWYLVFHTILGLLVDGWLFVVTILISRILNKISQDAFKEQKRRCQLILVSFVSSYIAWSILDIYTGIFGWYVYSDFTQVILTLMIQPALGNFIPIAILMFTHLSNVTSI